MPVKRLLAPPSPSFCLSFIFRPIFSQLYFVVAHFKAARVSSFRIISMRKKHRGHQQGDSGGQEKGTSLLRVSPFIRDSLRRSLQTQLPSQIRLHLVYLWGSQLPWRSSLSCYIINSRSPHHCMGKEILFPIKKGKKKLLMFAFSNTVSH